MTYLDLLKPFISDQQLFERYLNFIDTHKIENQNIDFYIEHHHIVPRSILKKNVSKEEYKIREADKDNIVALRARDHFLAHCYLRKACKGPEFTLKYFAGLCTKTTLWDEESFNHLAEVYETTRKEIARQLSVKLKNKKVSASTRRKMSESQKGKVISEETRKKLSTAHKGKIVSNETKKKISDSLIGNSRHKGCKHSEEAKKKMSEKAKGRKLSNETKQKLSVAHKGKNVSEEAKQKMRNTMVSIREAYQNENPLNLKWNDFKRWYCKKEN